MKNETKGLNLPAIKRNDGLSKVSTTSIQPIDLRKNNAVNAILKSNSSVQSDIFKREQGLDLVLVGDLTGSMARYHTLLKNKFEELCNELFPMIKNLKIGIIFYLDHGSGDPYVTSIQKLTSNKQEIIQFINNTSTGSGGDADEAVEDALNDLLNNMNWKESNSHSVVIFGDASPHRCSHCPHQYDFFNLTKQLYSKNITINSVYCEKRTSKDLQKLMNTKVGDFSERHSYLEAPSFFSWIANVTGGMVIGIENIEDLVDIIKASAAKDSGTLDDLEKKMKETSPKKLHLIEVARNAEKRKMLGQSGRKLLG